MSSVPPARVEHDPPLVPLDASAALLILLRFRRFLLLSALGAAVAVGAVLLVLPRWWRSSATFLPQSGRSSLSAGLGSLSGLATQLGVNLPAGEAGTAAQFYPALIRSHELLGTLVDGTYDDDDDASTPPRPLVQILGRRGATEAVRRERTIKYLREKLLTASTDTKTGMTTISVETHSPALSAALTQAILHLVAEFNEKRRQTSAGAERRFTEERLATTTQELRRAESALEAFLARNRTYVNSPSLRFDFERLSRELTLRQQLFTALSQAHDQARIEEVRDTPVLTLVDAASVPALPEERGLVLKSVLAAVLGLVAACLAILAREALGFGMLRQVDDVAASLGTEVRAVSAELRRPWRLLLPR